MQWDRDWGKSLAHLEAAQAQGFRVEALENRPQPPLNFGTVVQAMRDCAGDSGLAGIPFTSLAAWADRVGVDPFWLVDRVRTIEEAQRAVDDESTN